MTDWGALYADHVAGLAELGAELDEADLATIVAATPAWTVHDVFRHVAGVAADTVTGRMDGAPGPAWTARGVAEREDRSVPELVDELRAIVPAIQEAVADHPAPPVVWDIAVHHQDLYETLGRGQLPGALWTPIVTTLAPRVLGKQEASVRVGDTIYGAGGPDIAVTPYELFRTLFSRRSRGQINAWAEDALVIDQLCIFGPRDDDQPIP